MSSSYDVIGRRGHMEKGEHVSDEVVILLEDGEDTAIGRAPTEKKAVAAAKAELKRFRAEQAHLNHPAVIAARQALAEAIQLAKES